MTRRHHRRLSMKRRQFGPVFAADNTPQKSDPSSLSSTSSPDDATPPQPVPVGGPSTTNAGSKSNTGNQSGGNVPDAPPIGRPNEPNPVSPPTQHANLPSQPTGSNNVPPVDPFPPKGANQPQRSSVLPSPSSNSPSNTLAVSSGSASSATNSLTSSASLSSVSSLVTPPTRSTPTAAAAPVHTALSSSTPLAFNSLSPAATLVGTHSTITGLIPTSTSAGNSSAASTSSISTPAIVGIAAGGLCGLAILGAACLWIGKRVSRYMETRDLEPPPIHEQVADEDPAMITRRPSAPSSAPRPPTMIERRQANLAGRGNGFYNDNNNIFNPQNNFPPYAADPRFGNATPFAPGQYYPATPAPPPAAQPFFSPIATSSPFDDSAAAVPSAPGTPVYFSRQNSVHSGFGAAPSHNDMESQLPNPYDTPVARTNDGYATLNRGSGPATPQRQYTDLARQLGFSSPTDRTISPAPSTGSYAAVPLVSHNTGIPSSPRSPSVKAVPMSPSVVNVPSDLHEGRATPVQFGFTTPTTASVPSVLTPASGSASNARTSAQPGIPASQSAPSQSSRPETVYDEEDAYAAI